MVISLNISTAHDFNLVSSICFIVIRSKYKSYYGKKAILWENNHSIYLLSAIISLRSFGERILQEARFLNNDHQILHFANGMFIALNNFKQELKGGVKENGSRKSNRFQQPCRGH